MRKLTQKVSDSVFVYRHDSVFIRTQNDTVFYDRWQTLYKYKERTDTLQITDTVRVISMSEIEKPPSFWQNFQIKGFWICSAALLLIIVFAVIKFRLKR